MNLIRLSLSNPVAVIAAILMVLLLGIVGLSNLPICEYRQKHHD